MSNLYEASNQWSNRPADQRFWTLQEAYDQSAHYRSTARQATVKLNRLRVEERDNNELALVGSQAEAQFTNYAFGQLANRIGAPAGYLRTLPASIAATALTHGLSKHDGDGVALIHQNGHNVLRCITSDSYSRIWNSEIIERLLPLTGNGWRVPPARPSGNSSISRPATAQDCLEVKAPNGLAIKVGDPIAPAGIYVSDHDMFVFLVNEQNRIEDGSESGLSRGVFIINSEVGAAAYRMVKFLYRGVCGNHIVWNASEISELKIVHRGSADLKFSRQMAIELRNYESASAYETQDKIRAAQRYTIADSKDKVLDLLFGKKIASRADLESSYQFAIEQADTTNTGGPNTAWGFAQGMTRYSQTKQFADDRHAIDRAAGKVIEMAF